MQGGTPLGRTPLSSQQGLPSAQEEGQAALSSLDREFEKKRALFDDDADFIREASGLWRPWGSIGGCA